MMRLGLLPCCLGNFAESVDGRCTFEEIKYVLPYFPWASGAEGAASDDQTRFDPTDPLIEQGIGWRLIHLI